MEDKCIFIQVPDDITVKQEQELSQALQKAKLPYSFIIVPYFYKAMSRDEIRSLLENLSAPKQESDREIAHILVE